MPQTKKSRFQYQKLASDDGDISSPDLKSNTSMAAFGESTTEKVNFVYLDVIDAPC